jgi:hypothetical protein
MSKLNFEKSPKAAIYTEASRGTNTNPRIYTGAHRLAGARRYLKTARGCRVSDPYWDQHRSPLI